ncbi:hypothetical protein FACS1894219_04380 [Clostridia bacterium]|nr:hypothetical protein FACS1894219_04380 [Clostridia bacterium]
MFGGDKAEKAYILFSESVTSLLTNDLQLGRGTFYDQVRMYAQAVPDMRKSQTSRVFSNAVDTIGRLCSDALEKHRLNPQQVSDFIRKLQSEFLPLLKGYYNKIADKYFPQKFRPKPFRLTVAKLSRYWSNRYESVQ